MSLTMLYIYNSSICNTNQTYNPYICKDKYLNRSWTRDGWTSTSLRPSVGEEERSKQRKGRRGARTELASTERRDAVASEEDDGERASYQPSSGSGATNVTDERTGRGSATQGGGGANPSAGVASGESGRKHGLGSGEAAGGNKSAVGKTHPFARGARNARPSAFGIISTSRLSENLK